MANRINHYHGAEHGSWKGDDVSYAAAHYRIEAERGKASEYLCHCGEHAAEWAYDGRDFEAERRDDAGLHAGMLYSLKLDHYIPMCMPCHKRFDGMVRTRTRKASVLALREQGLSYTKIAELTGYPKTTIAKDIQGLFPSPPKQVRDCRGCGQPTTAKTGYCARTKKCHNANKVAERRGDNG